MPSHSISSLQWRVSFRGTQWPPTRSTFTRTFSSLEQAENFIRTFKVRPEDGDPLLCLEERVSTPWRRVALPEGGAK